MSHGQYYIVKLEHATHSVPYLAYQHAITRAKVSLHKGGNSVTMRSVLVFIAFVDPRRHIRDRPSLARNNAKGIPRKDTPRTA